MEAARTVVIRDPVAIFHNLLIHNLYRTALAAPDCLRYTLLHKELQVALQRPTVYVRTKRCQLFHPQFSPFQEESHR